MKTMLGGFALSAFALSMAFAGDAQAQYLRPADTNEAGEPTSGYFPQGRTVPNLSLAGSESGFNPYQPPWARIGLALDFGAGGLMNRRLDDNFYSLNGAPNLGGVTAFAWDFTFYGQFRDVFRVGLHVGGLSGGQRDVDASILNAGLVFEGGKRFYTGWGLWMGASIGYGRGLASSEPFVGSEPYYYDYESVGLGVRGFARFERELAPFITLRLTPFVDTIVRTDDRYTLNLPEGQTGNFPDRSKGTFVGYGVMLGVAIHSF